METLEGVSVAVIWTQSMLRQVLERELSDKEYAENFGTTPAAVRAARFRQRLDARSRQAQYNAKYYARINQGRHKSFRPWTPEEDAAIMAVDRPSDKVLQKRLNRRPCAIRSRRQRLKSQS